MRWTVRFVATFSMFSAGLLVSAEETYKLEEPADDVRVFGVGMRVQVNGKLQVGTSEPGKVNPLALDVTAALSYRERRLVGLGRDALGLRSLRDYEVTQADIGVADQKTLLKLDDRLKLMVAQGRPEGIELYSLHGPLTNNEVELLRAPGDSLSLPALLPSKEIAVGDTWSPPSWAVQLFAGMEAVTTSELKCTLQSVDGDLAKIQLEGKLEGATGGAPTKVTIQGTFDYQLKDKYIAAAEITQTEQRHVGAISPGLDIKARVRLLRKPAQDPGRIADPKLIHAAASEPEPSAKFLRFDSPWNLSLMHSRNWHMFHQTDKVAIFRLIDQGALVAQCNLSAINPAKPGSHTSEQEFQTDIKSSLGDSFGKLESAKAIPTSDGRYIYQVIATGTSKERKLTWIYYLIAEPSGRQASLQFSLDSTLVETLANRDRELVDSLRFVAASAASTPTPRKQ